MVATALETHVRMLRRAAQSESILSRLAERMYTEWSSEKGSATLAFRFDSDEGHELYDLIRKWQHDEA